MQARLIKSIIISSTLVALVFTGCAESNKVALNFNDGSKATYEISMANQRNVKFERPGDNSVSDKVTRSNFTMVFDQEIVAVAEDGTATAKITVKSVKMEMENPKNGKSSYDSATAAAGSPLAQLVGKSYLIDITPMGLAKVKDLSEMNSISKAGQVGKIVASLFSKDAIEERHSIAALSGKDAEGNIVDKTNLTVGSSWSVVEPSPKGMMQSKKYEKIYTLDSVKDVNGEKIATISMTTIPSDAGVSSGGMFAMFGDKIDSDFQDTYEGKMKLNLVNGEVIEYNEDLDAQWIAVDRSKIKPGSETAPDTLTLGFVKKFSIKTIK